MSPFTLPFLLLGIWLIRLLRHLREHDRGTWYVVTNQRAIVWRPSLFGFTTTRASSTPEGLRRMECDSCAEEFGSLVFHTVSAYSEDSSGYGFLNIRDPRVESKR